MKSRQDRLDQLRRFSTAELLWLVGKHRPNRTLGDLGDSSEPHGPVRKPLSIRDLKLIEEIAVERLGQRSLEDRTLDEWLLLEEVQGLLR